MTSSNIILNLLPSNSTALSSLIDGRATVSRSVLFIDAIVGDYQQLLASAESGAEVYLLDGRRDAIDQITDALRGRSTS
ncbi:MAG: DUF4347 domain-containing protein [Alkalinema sp. RU_4_3]|nr:DUF4347 domain-containing protein [Alkalinema sp. RU_4_3]